MTLQLRAAVALFATLGLVGSAAGCKDKTAQEHAPPATPAVLIGSVRLAPGTELPRYLPQEMERQMLRAKAGSTPGICSPPTAADRTPVRLTDDGKLIGVVVVTSEFSRSPPPHIARVFPVHIRDCRLTPRLILAQSGDSMHLENETDFPFMPGLGVTSFNETLLKGQTHDYALTTDGAKVLSCGFTAQCGRTDVIVLSHPFAAVTNDKGEFRIDDFPADETVRVHAWHPLFSPSYVDVRVAHGETKQVELVLTPREPPQAPEPAPQPTAAGPK